MNPWMGALEDNLEVLTGLGSEGEPRIRRLGQKSHRRFDPRAASKVKSLNFMRGRTVSE